MTLAGFFARVDAFWHLVRGHQIAWVVDASELCDGDIICDTCSAVLWCRYHDLSSHEKAIRQIEEAAKSANATTGPGIQGEDGPAVA